MILHKHLLINAKINKPMKSEDEAIEFLKDLVSSINMKIIKGPFASYVDVVGNRGLTAMVMIETSHIAFHIWDEQSPALLQFDLYTCGYLDTQPVLNTIEKSFEVASLEYQLFDRKDGFKLEAQGSR
jgi:S-adenosylmethionine/arginine decarboxylase-like enzyme